MAQTKYFIDQTVLLLEPNQQELPHFAPSGATSALTIGIGTFLLLQSYMNIKQLTYIVRVAMLLTVLSMIYLNGEVYYRYFILS